ncbi:RNA polymerase sigma factor [Steroidobacter agaridevorans]|nr:RNA polymerase sigma factor [Steroidobacter agaridevorans]
MRESLTTETIEAVWRIESARLLGGLVRVVRDLSLAEDLAQEALLAALERWPGTGVPNNPGAWLMAAAKNRAIDQLRRRGMLDRTHARMQSDATTGTSADRHEIEADSDEGVDDELLRLILIACHPVLSKEARVALTLRLLGGLTTDQIARAFLVPETTIAQRIVRAKRTLAEARVPFEIPRAEDLADRLPSVFEVIYLIFNEGYAATRGKDWMRLELCEEALRLARILAERVPDNAEVHGLVALMELHSSRARARLGPSGEPILLLDQDRSRWDQLLVHRGLAALARAEALASPLGPYALQAAIAACHAQARSADETDWKKIVALYDALVEITQSPLVELNRAIAVGMAFGAEAGLELIDALTDEPALRGYHLLPSVRGDLLSKLGRVDEAYKEFGRAAVMAQNVRERELLLARAKACAGETGPP